MAAQFPDFHSTDIEQRIVSIKKQKSFVQRLKHRLEMRVEKETMNAKKRIYLKQLILACDDKLDEFDSILKSCESLKNYHSQFKCA